MIELSQPPFYAPPHWSGECFDVNSICVQLAVETKLLDVMVKGLLDGETVREAAIASDERKFAIRHKPSRRKWRAIVTLTAPTQLAGWGSFEREELVDTAGCVSGQGVPEEEVTESSQSEGCQGGGGELARGLTPGRVAAVLISTKQARDGLAFGFFGFSRPVCQVLFCVPLKGLHYKRVGVGRIFAKEAVRELCGSAPRVFSLV
jgi:hypothetical protein